MKLLEFILKTISFICGVCTYVTVVVIALIGYKFIMKAILTEFPHKYPFTPDVLRVIVLIGVLSMVSFTYSKIKDAFWSPTIRFTITKK
jgi:hypothetical protein